MIMLMLGSHYIGMVHWQQPNVGCIPYISSGKKKANRIAKIYFALGLAFLWIIS